MPLSTLSAVDVRIVRGPQCLLRYMDAEVTAATTFLDLLKAGLAESILVDDDEVNSILEKPVAITVHPTAERTHDSAMGVRSLDLVVMTRCRTEKQHCVLFRLCLPDLQP